jgi:hypothetical protein
MKRLRCASGRAKPFERLPSTRSPPNREKLISKVPGMKDRILEEDRSRDCTSTRLTLRSVISTRPTHERFGS